MQDLTDIAFTQIPSWKTDPHSEAFFFWQNLYHKSPIIPKPKTKHPELYPNSVLKNEIPARPKIINNKRTSGTMIQHQGKALEIGQACGGGCVWK